MATQLIDLEIETVAGVDEPANGSQTGGAGGWLVIKQRKEPGMPDKPDQDLAALVATLTVERDEALAKAKEAEDKLAAAAPTEPEPDPVAKAISGLGPEDAERVRKALADAEEAKAEVAKMRDEAATAEWVSKARADLDGLALDPVAFGPVLKRVSSAATPEDAAEMWRVLKGAAAAAARAEEILGTSLGSAGPRTGGEARTEALAKAREYQAANPGTSDATALVAVLKSDSDLAGRVRAEEVEVH